MSRHLTSHELIDDLDGTLDRPRAAHLDACARCREQAAALSGVMTELGADEVPEPSPLFWEHFSARVRQSTAEAAAPASGLARVWKPAAALLGACAAGLLLAAVLWWPAGGRPASPDARVADISVEDPILADDGPWTLIVLAAESVAWDEAADHFPVAPDVADEAVAGLSSAERAEFARLIQADLPGGVS
jgi:hypothetical protein